MFIILFAVCLFVCLFVCFVCLFVLDWAEGIRRLLSFNKHSSLSYIAVGAFHTILVSGLGFVYSYGLNDCMQLGCIDTAQGVPLPIHPITGLKQPVQVKEICCGVNHSLLLTQQGKVYAWGGNK